MKKTVLLSSFLIGLMICASSCTELGDLLQLQDDPETTESSTVDSADSDTEAESSGEEEIWEEGESKTKSEEEKSEESVSETEAEEEKSEESVSETEAEEEKSEEGEDETNAAEKESEESVNETKTEGENSEESVNETKAEDEISEDEKIEDLESAVKKENEESLSSKKSSEDQLSDEPLKEAAVSSDKKSSDNKSEESASSGLFTLLLGLACLGLAVAVIVLSIKLRNNDSEQGNCYNNTYGSDDSNEKKLLKELNQKLVDENRELKSKLQLMANQASGTDLSTEISNINTLAAQARVLINRITNSQRRIDTGLVRVKELAEAIKQYDGDDYDRYYYENGNFIQVEGYGDPGRIQYFKQGRFFYPVITEIIKNSIGSHVYEKEFDFTGDDISEDSFIIPSSVVEDGSYNKVRIVSC